MVELTCRIYANRIKKGNQALTVLIQQESARQLAKLSGSQPDFECTPRHCELDCWKTFVWQP